MPSGTPELATNRLVDRVNLLLEKAAEENNYNANNDMEWMRLYKELEKVRSGENLPMTLILSAIMFALKKDKNKAMANLSEYAFKFGKTKLWMKTSYEVTQWIGDVSMLVDLKDNFYPEKHDLLGLTAAFLSCRQMGLFVSARKALLDLLAIDKEDILHTTRGSQEPILKAAEYIESEGLNEVEIASRMFIATSIVEKYAHAAKYRIITNECGIEVSYPLEFDSEKLIDIDFEIIEAISNEFHDSLSNHIGFITTPVL